MKNLIILSALLFCISACQSKKSEASSTEEVVKIQYASYGELIESEGAKNVFAVDELMAGKDSLSVKLTGEIEKTCAMKGCWMTVKTGDSTNMRVTFKDYGFFVPTNGVEGKTAIMEGAVTKTTTSVADLRHYAKDAGMSEEEIYAITEPKEEFAFVATGVLIAD